MFRYLESRGVLRLGVLMFVLTGCADANPDPAAEPCVENRLANQPRNRFPAGQTYYLPQLSSDESCSGLSWQLLTGPASNASVVVTTDGDSRFTTSHPGTYEFALEGGSALETLTVVGIEERPFHNLHYYPSRSQTLVGDELWVANNFRPTVSRIRRSDRSVIGEIVVGDWPVALAHETTMDVVLVAQRGSDNLGFVDTASGEIVDAVWIGDEPSNVVVSPDGARAYVTSATEGVVVVVDVASRSVVARIDAVPDLLGLAINPDGSRVYAAGHRTGDAERYPFGMDAVEDERDIVVIDTASLTVIDTWLDVGATIKALEVSADGQAVYVAQVANDTVGTLGSDDVPSFQHQVLSLNAVTGERQAEADLGRQATSNGQAVTLHGLAEVGDRVWVVAEGSDLTVALNASTLAEEARVETPGRPRHILSAPEGLFVHGVQGFVVTQISEVPEVLGSVMTAEDPRGEDLARGQRYFTGAGIEFAQSWACNSCHSDGLSDGQIWQAGPFEDGRALTRSYMWLEGTFPLGVDGYLSGVKNFAYEVNTNVGRRPDTQQATDLYAYLRSLMAPPAANGWTARDGSLSALAQRGREIFNNEAGCTECHAGPTLSSREILEQGLSEQGLAAVPTLIGSYRLSTFLRTGEDHSLRAVAERGVARAELPALDAAQMDALEQYLRELTDRDFFVLHSEPMADSMEAPVDRGIELIFNQPVYADAENLSQIQLLDASQSPVAATVTAEGRYVRIDPEENLAFSTGYVVVISEAFEALDERRPVQEQRISFQTAAQPTANMDGDYIWTIDVPSLNFAERTFDPTATNAVQVGVTATATASGANIDVNLGRGLTWSGTLVVDGDRLLLPALPIPIGPSFGNGWLDATTIGDRDSDGVADDTSGTVSMTGPGFRVSDITWRLQPASEVDACIEGASGAFVVELETNAEGVPVFRWDGEALGLYVTGPLGQPPMGPGQTVSGDRAYWAIAATTFPNGFVAPVTYGVLPSDAEDQAELHSAEFGVFEAGTCYKISVISTSFQIGQLVIRWPEESTESG